ncbi:MAG: hypothetical protein IT443_07545 [Phycisphaeraceae bacterium]|nr:hypothetical protein [Phycisphaeraceae bacterium]
MRSYRRTTIRSTDRLRLGPGAKAMFNRCVAVALAGGVAAVAGSMYAQDSYRRFMLAYVTAFAFVLSLSLGGLFFVLIQHLTRAGWSVLVRRPAEILAANLGLTAVLFLPIAGAVAIGGGEVYPWAGGGAHAVAAKAAAEAQPVQAHEDGHALEAGAAQAGGHGKEGGHEERLAKKRAYLNPPFFLLRWVGYFALWGGLGYWYWRSSSKQDASGDHRLTVRMETLAGPALLLFGLTITFGAIDLLMSLDPHWYSTIFGVYYFAGSAVAVLAALIVIFAGLQRAGYLAQSITVEHYHDLGKMLFGFVFFWGYIAFSQYMLIWYANIPETTGWFRTRGATTVAADINGWTWVGLMLVIGNFVLPFVGLLSRHVKRYRPTLVFWAGWLLVMHYLDLLWLVMPEFGPQLTLGVVEIGVLAWVAGLYLAGAVYLAGKHDLAPSRDPRLPESLAFENM